VRTDDRGSLPLAMLAVLVSSLLGALILPIVIQQNQATRFDVTRVHSLHAAQTGVDLMLGMIRAASSTDSSGTTLGDPTKLPCYDSSGPLTGSANGTGQAAYSVSVTYYVANPATGGATMTCSPGYGTYDPTTHTATPRYAVITATGTDGTVDSGSRGRTVVSTYVFQTDDTSATGGQIRIYPDSSGTRLCMDAGSAAPAAGTQVLLQACSNSTPVSAQQVFAYRSDLSIQLVSSVGTDQPTGLCLDTASTPHQDGLGIVLQPCGVAEPAKCATITACSPWNQQWSVDDNAHLRGANSAQSNTDGFCIHAPSQTPGVGLLLESCSGGTSSTQQTWIPAPTAGAGMAGADNNQLVNYREFATCLDVTGQDINASYLILYTCKQNPDPSKVLWNQKFTPTPALATEPTATLLTTTAGGRTYCLTSPLSAGGYPTMRTPCPSSATVGNAATWTMYQLRDATGNDLPYALKYTIVDSAGRCLAPGANSDMYLTQYLKAVVTRCDGSTGQKWNASASLDTSKMTNTHER
jgi:hypothetical protein